MSSVLNKCAIVVFFALAIGSAFTVTAQDLYTARSYWKESTREPYLSLKYKQTNGDSLTAEESSYLQDYELFLNSYYNRLPDSEKNLYEQMKDQWNRTIRRTQAPTAEVSSEEFEWRGRDRALNTAYGIWYGTSIDLLFGIEGAGAAGIPLITGGLWVLGPVINPKKYEGIDRSVVQANNTGKFLGLLYGVSTALMVSGDTDNSYKWQAFLSSAGSITLGEVGFQLQKRKHFSEGHISMLRHYGVLGPWLGGSVYIASGSDNANLAGASLLGGGVLGLLAGNSISKKYDYTRGDVYAVTSLGLISTGVGFALMAESLDDTNASEALILIPAAGTLIGTMLGQHQVKNAYLTKQQGSTINLATAGAALVGVGVMAIAESESPGVWVGVPSALALLTHQLVLNRYKRENLASGIQSRLNRKKNFALSVNLTPENYFINRQMGPSQMTATGMPLANPMFNLRIGF